MVKDTTLYNILEVAEDASNAEILKAYKKIAIKSHPDKNPDDPDANQKFQNINQAKEILSNAEKRKMYDNIGMDYVNGNAQQQQGMNQEDLFNMFGGGGGGFPGHPFGNMNRQQQQQKENIIINQEVTLEEIYTEANISINFQQKQSCEGCKGEGTKNGVSSKCGTCDGNGVRVQVVQMGPMIQQMQIQCQSCNGSGKNNNAGENCNICTGNGFKTKDVRVNIPLKNGLSNGQQIQIPGHGHNLKDGKTDLIIVINEKPHAVFKRSNNDLYMEVELKLFQAIYGFEKTVEHLDKRKLHISHSGKIEYGELKKIPNEGMVVLNSSTNKGDLIIKFNIVLPMLDNAEMSNKLLYLLKTLDQDEANNETIIKNSKSKYVKTVLLNSDTNPFDNPQSNTPFNQQQQQQQQHQQHQQQQQCVHQ
jgi:DnaJ family protein A protein 2